jgi:hypothetical protein
MEEIWSLKLNLSNPIRYFIMKKLLFLCSLLAFNLSAFAQHTIQGTVIDSSKSPLAYTSVALTKQSDSSLVSFAVSNTHGQFVLKPIPKGNYRIQFSYLGYKNMYMNLEIDGSKQVISLGNIILEENNHLLHAVNIEADAIPIVLKKDTIEYNADAFKTQTNAVVEDLLKELPGVEVDSEGKIKAQGKEVEKIMVDGKEFFANDPKLATKNLPAEAIDKVQVYDKKSDAAEFTGVDDGERIKTINLTLKEDKKKGYFGLLKGGYGTENRYESSVNINRFTNKLQLSAIGMSNNINDQGFSMNDYINFMGGIQNIMSGNGLSFSSEDLGMNMQGDDAVGALTSAAGGINANYQFKKFTQLNLNYFHNGMFNHTQQEQERIYSNNPYLSKAEEQSILDAQHFNHRINLKFKHRIDSLNDIILKGNFGYNNGSSDINGLLNNYNLQSALASLSNTNNNYSKTGLSYEGKLIFRKKFNKRGRILSFGIESSKQNQSTQKDINNIKTVYDTLLGLNQKLLQFHHEQLNKLQYAGQITYTEPIAKKHFISFSYSLQMLFDYSDYQYFDKNVIDPSEQTFNPELSNQLESQLKRQTTGIDWKSSFKKLKLNAGLDFSYIDFSGQQNEAFALQHKIYRNFLPSGMLRFDINKQSNLSMQYYTYLNTPTMRQLQPIVDNTALDQYYVGNPDLNPEYVHSASLNYHYYSMFSNVSLFSSLQATLSQNKITNSVLTDSLLINTYQPINNGDGQTLMAYLDFSAPIKALKLKFNIDFQSIYDQSSFLYNQQTDRRENLLQIIGFSLENRNKKHFDLEVGTRLNHNKTSYSQNAMLNNSYLMPTHFAIASVDFLKHWTFKSQVRVRMYPKEMIGFDDQDIIWEAQLARSILKNKALISIRVHDILNQNTGIEYYNHYDYSAWERTNTIGRYFMLSFSYNLSGFGK